MIVVGGNEDAPAIDHRCIDDGHAQVLAPDVTAGLGIHADHHAEARSDVKLAFIVGDAAAHALIGADGVLLAEQAPEGGPVGAVARGQLTVPDRRAAGGAEGKDMGFGVQRKNHPAADHRRGRQIGIAVGALAGADAPDLAQAARRRQVVHGVGGIAARQRPFAVAIGRRQHHRRCCDGRIGLEALIQRHHRNANAAQVGFLAAGFKPAADLVGNGAACKQACRHQGKKDAGLHGHFAGAAGAGAVMPGGAVTTSGGTVPKLMAPPAFR